MHFVLLGVSIGIAFGTGYWQWLFSAWGFAGIGVGIGLSLFVGLHAFRLRALAVSRRVAEETIEGITTLLDDQRFQLLRPADVATALRTLKGGRRAATHEVSGERYNGRH